MIFSSSEWTRQLTGHARKMAMPIVTYPGLKLTGKKVIDLVTNGTEQARCIEMLAMRYNSAAAVMVMDLSVEAEAFGSAIKFSDHEIPVVSGQIIFDSGGINALQVPEVGTARTAEYINAATLAAEVVGNKPVFGGIIGPFSLAGRLLDITEIMTFILIDPEASHILLEKSTRFLVNYAKAYKKAGAHGLVIAEPAAGLLSPDACLEFSSVYVKKIVEAVQDENFMVILHNCGNTVPLVPAMLSTGALGLHFGNAVDMKDILPQIPSHILAFGNLDPAGVIKSCDAATVKARTKQMLGECSQYRNYVPSSGCDVPPGTPLENIAAFYEAIDEFNAGF